MTRFSDYGKASVDVYAPGVNIFSTVSYKSYFPSVYNAQQLNATTEYYGEFNADTQVAHGTVTPSTGSKAGADIKSLSDSYSTNHSCAVTRDGIYYIRRTADENNIGWELKLLNNRSGVYESPFADVILGDADGDGKVTINDATMIRKYLAEKLRHFFRHILGRCAYLVFRINKKAGSDRDWSEPVVGFAIKDKLCKKRRSSC